MAVSPTPINVNWGNYSNRVKPDVLASDPDIVLVNPSTLPIDLQSDLILQDMGGTELLYYARHDTVNGQKVSYQPIKDVDLLALTYSPQTVTGAMPAWSHYRNSFSIQIDDKRIADSPNSAGSVYVDTNVSGTGSNIIVELDNLSPSDVVEIAYSIPERVLLMERPAFPILGGSADGTFGGTIDGGSSLGYNIDMSIDGGGA